MRNRLLIAGLMAATLPALATPASAQPYDPGCVRDNRENNRAGTAVGAVAGALLGGAVAGRHNRGAGAVIGGVTGAVAGNAIARSNDHPCPSGYYYAAPPPPPPVEGGFWRGAPGGIHERIDFTSERIDRARAEGRLRRREADAAYADLNDIRRQEDRMRYRGHGHLNPADRDYLQQRLDALSGRIHWESRGD